MGLAGAEPGTLGRRLDVLVGDTDRLPKRCRCGYAPPRARWPSILRLARASRPWPMAIAA